MTSDIKLVIPVYAHTIFGYTNVSVKAYKRHKSCQNWSNGLNWVKKDKIAYKNKRLGILLNISCFLFKKFGSC